jgi:hypothetical protein
MGKHQSKEQKNYPFFFKKKKKKSLVALLVSFETTVKCSIFKKLLIYCISSTSFFLLSLLGININDAKGLLLIYSFVHRLEERLFALNEFFGIHKVGSHPFSGYIATILVYYT